MPPTYKTFALGGGLDLETPEIKKTPGGLIGCKNMEATSNGYRWIDGFERFSGQPKPSDASYWRLDFDAGTTAMSVGDVVTGGSSGATATVLVDAVLLSGSYGGSDAVGYVILTGLAGSFVDNEDLEVSSTKVAEANGTAQARGASNDEDDETWRQAAIEAARSDIAAPTGSGPIRGVWVDRGTKYAFRDNAGATACIMHKATSTGWVAQSFGSYLKFKAGTVEFVEGDTLTGGTSGATATIDRVCRRGGAYGDGDADGHLVLSGISGTFVDSETVTGSSAGSATTDGADVAITLPPGGRYEFRSNNFFGASDLAGMYFVNGVGPAMEWRDDILTPIFTGMVVDTPSHIGVHFKHLFLAFPGGSLQHSGIGDPYAWSPLLGAGEIGLGEPITNLLEDYANIMVVFGRNKVAILYGTNAADWNLTVHSNDAGAVQGSAQKIGAPIYLDDRGLRRLDTSQDFGDFRMNTLTQLISKVFKRKRDQEATVVASCRVRAKDQYRLFFSDKTGITIYLGKEYPESTLFVYDRQMTAVCSAEEDNGDEVILAGDEDGWVYQLDAGTSFDGEVLSFFMRLPFNNLGTPRHEKQFYQAVIETDATANVEIGMLAIFSYGDPSEEIASDESLAIAGGGGFWDDGNSFWEGFSWDAPVSGVATADTDGQGMNCSLFVVGQTTYAVPSTFYAVTLHYSLLRMMR